MALFRGIEKQDGGHSITGINMVFNFYWQHFLSNKIIFIYLHVKGVIVASNLFSEYMYIIFIFGTFSKIRDCFKKF